LLKKHPCSREPKNVSVSALLETEGTLSDA
jgi:hypothetical protein